MSNAQRQRAFQARHPGYDRRRKARARAAAERGSAILLAEMLAQATRQPLLLPAPVRDETMAAIEAIALSLVTSTAKVAVPVQ